MDEKKMESLLNNTKEAEVIYVTPEGEAYEEPQGEVLPVTKPKKKKGAGKLKKLVSLLLIIALSAGAGFGGGIAAMYYGQNLIPGAGITNEITIRPNEQIDTAEAVAAKVIPSVVGISITGERPSLTWYGQTVVKPTAGVGTGLIVDEKGYILTNSHVVDDGKAKTIVVQLYDGREVPGTVLWNDKSVDLAIVKIEADNLVAGELGNSDDVRVGAYAVAIGNPLGLAFDRSVTQGVISGLNRTIRATDGQQQTTMEGLMQTDASINSGNSGGPLLNSKGQVIGINTAKAQAEGLGFAIPINTAKPIVEEIKTKGEFKRAYMGIRGISVADFLQRYPDQNLGTKTGAYLAEVIADSPAAAAGLKEGDIILELEGVKIETAAQFAKELFKHRPGDTVQVTILRNFVKSTVDVTLTEMVEGE